MSKTKNKTKLVSSENIEFIRNNPRFTYTFKQNVPQEVDELHVNFLISHPAIKEVK